MSNTVERFIDRKNFERKLGGYVWRLIGLCIVGEGGAVHGWHVAHESFFED